MGGVPFRVLVEFALPYLISGADIMDGGEFEQINVKRRFVREEIREVAWDVATSSVLSELVGEIFLVRKEGLIDIFAECVEGGITAGGGVSDANSS